MEISGQRSVESNSLRAPHEFDSVYAELLKALAGESGKMRNEAIEKFSGFFSDRLAVKSRLEVMLNDRLQQPMHRGREPAMYDYLPVDLTLRPDESLPTIDIDAWSEFFRDEA